MKSDWDMIEGLALRLVQGLEEAHVNWWVFDGWSFRKLGQLELEVSNGRGSEDNVGEPQPEGGPVPQVEAKDDGRIVVVGQNLASGEVQVGSSKAARRLLKAKTRPSRLGRGARRRMSKRGWR